MIHWVSICSLGVVFSTLPFAFGEPSNSGRPLIVSLPIRVQTNGPFPYMPNDFEPEDSEEDNPPEDEPILLPRNYDLSIIEMRQHRQYSEDDSAPDSEPGFLNWSPNNRMMMLQINDYISARNEDDSDSEESNRPEGPQFLRPGHSWAYQGSYDFEDDRTFPAGTDNLYRLSRSSSKMRNANNYRLEDDDESDVYGTDPVVHFLRNRSKNVEKDSDFREVHPVSEDGFNFRDWWRY